MTAAYQVGEAPLTVRIEGEFIVGIGSQRIDCGARLIESQPVDMTEPALWSLTPRGVVELDRKPKGRPR